MEDELKRKLPPGCYEDTDRHGNPRVYYRPKKTDPKIRIRGVPWTPSFMEQYETAKNGTPVAAKSAIKPGSFRWLTLRYMKECPEHLRNSHRTRHVRKLILESICLEPIKEGGRELFADIPVGEITDEHIEKLRDRKIHFPEAANSRMKALKRVFKWSTKKRITRTNPTLGVEKFNTGSDGWHTWTVPEVQQYEKRHAVGTKARLFLALILFLGVRRSDAVRLGKQHVRWAIARINGKPQQIKSVTFTVFKGRNKKPKQLTLPILPPLQEVLDASPLGELTWLVNDLGNAFSDAGIGNKMREWCDQAGLPHCSAHGVRKAGATILAEKGATARQLMAVFGWEKITQAEIYTKKADQKHLAESVMGNLIDWDSPDISVSPFEEKAK